MSDETTVALPTGKRIALNGQAYEVVMDTDVSVRPVETKRQVNRHIKGVCPTGCIVPLETITIDGVPVKVGTNAVWTVRAAKAEFLSPKGCPVCPMCGERAKMELAPGAE